ncbi:MAG TPA: PilC/PilY family type IV pilus protein, partial [Gammaproteobacteria bacterium]
WDTSVIDGTEYRSPLDVNCAKIFVINVVDGGGNSADDANTAINMSVTAGGMVDTPNFTYGNGDTGFVQMVDWLNDTDLADGSINGLDVSGDQTVTSFFVAKHTSQVDAAAAAGGTGYGIQLGVNAEEVVDALNKIFNQVVSVSTTFVAASIPVNAFNRSSVLDNAYLALFQANENVQPNWVGNLKKLKLRIKPVCNQFDPATNTCIDSENILMLVDNLDPNNSAIANDGRIIQDAFTFWTQANGYDLFDNIDPDIETAGRDGRSVNRGGAGQQIPNFINADGTQGAMNWLNSSNGRRLYTEAKPYITTSNGLLDVQWDQIYYLWPSILGPDDSYRLTQWPTNFTYTGSWSPDAYLDTGIACHTFYGSANSYLYSSCWIGDIASNVLAYMRGYNTQATVDTERDKSRRWLMNDPLHSRPRPINYGARGLGYSQTNPDIHILMGSNDGYLRMIRNTNPDGSDDGSEVWAFMPRAVMKYQKQLMDNGVWNNNPVIPRHPIGTDGPPVEYINDVDGDGTIDPADGDQVWIFFGLRRGGRGYYALDISDPDNPKTLWASGKIDNTLPDFTELGLTFSQPTIRKLKWGNNTVEKPVLIFGGGYDTNKDAPGIGTNDSMGRAVYVVDAASGTLVWKADYTSTNGLMTDSIPSEVTPFDATGDGIVDRFYVGDTGGQLWRADLTGTDVSQWKITRILNVGRHYSATSVADDRRFFFPPEVVSTMDGSGAYVGVVIGSGNREHPLDLTITDWMYLYKDRQATALTADFSMLTHDQLQDVTDNCVQQVALDCATDFSLTNGWRLRLEDQGEKSLSPPLVVRGVVYFNTYVPAGSASATSCGPDEGTGWYYEVALRDGRAVTNYDSTNTAVDAEGNTVELQKEDRRVTLASGGIPAENVYVSFSDGTNSFTGILRPDLKAGQDLGRGRWRTYWYEQQK